MVYAMSQSQQMKTEVKLKSVKNRKYWAITKHHPLHLTEANTGSENREKDDKIIM